MSTEPKKIQVAMDLPGSRTSRGPIDKDGKVQGRPGHPNLSHGHMVGSFSPLQACIPATYLVALPKAADDGLACSRGSCLSLILNQSTKK